MTAKREQGGETEVCRQYLSNRTRWNGKKRRKFSPLDSQAPLAKKTALGNSLSALVNDQDVLEVETGLDDKEMVPW